MVQLLSSVSQSMGKSDMKILIADDHTIVREGLKTILNKMGKNSTIEEAEDGNIAFEKIENNEYDLIILDISMPELSGLDILKKLKDRNKKVKVLMLSLHPQEQYAIRALNLGASGYINKSSIYEELEVAIKKIIGGGKYISPELSEKVVFEDKDYLNKLPHEKLSEREFQIMCMFAEGISIKDISEKLFISDKTVSTHRMHILEKMDMKNNSELIHYAINNNLIE